MAIVMILKASKIKTQEVKRKVSSLIKGRCITNGGRMPLQNMYIENYEGKSYA